MSASLRDRLAADEPRQASGRKRTAAAQSARPTPLTQPARRMTR